MPPKASTVETIDSVDAAIALAVACGEDWKQLSEHLLPALNALVKKGAGSKGQATQTWQEVLAGSTGEGGDPLNILNPATSSLLWLYILVARAERRMFPTGNDFINCVITFGQAAHVQIFLAPAMVIKLAETVVAWCAPAPVRPTEPTHRLTSQNFAIVPLSALARAASTGVPPGTLTPIHRMLAYAALQAGNYGPDVINFISTPMTNVESQWFSISYQDNLLYHFYAGLLAAAAGHYDLAIELLELCVSAPTLSTPSAIQIDAYKKLVLIQLVHRGKVASLPRYTAPGVASSCKNLGLYADLVSAFTRLDRTKFSETAQKNVETLTKDGNFGLVSRCLSRFNAFQIRKLTHTYVTLPLPELARRLGLPATAEGLNTCMAELQQLVDNREIFARLTGGTVDDLSTATIEFTDDPEPHNTARTVQKLETVIYQARQRTHVTQDRDDQMAGSLDFLKKALQSSSGGGSGPGGMFGGAAGFGALDESDLWEVDDATASSFFS